MSPGYPRCIWMEAEVVEYKLCATNYNCEACDFHYRVSNPAAVPAGEPPRPEAGIPIRLEFPDPLDFRPGYQYYASHCWIRHVSRNLVVLGIDDFLTGLWAAVERCIPVAAGSELSARACFAWLVLPGGIVYLRLPFAGRVAERNPRLAASDFDFGDFSTLAFADRWIVKLDLMDQNLDRSQWLTRAQYQLRLREDLDLVMSFLKENLEDRNRAVAADGGRLRPSGPRVFQLSRRRLRELVRGISGNTHDFH